MLRFQNGSDTGDVPVTTSGKGSDNAATEDNHKAVKVVPRFPKWPSIIMLLIIIMEFVFLAFLASVAFFSRPLDMNVINGLVEGSFVATGIAIIGIAISIWAGLNIANAIDRSSIAQMDDSIAKMGDSIAQMDNFIKKQKKDQDEIDNWREEHKKSELELLLQELLKTDQDSLSRLFYKKISKPNFKIPDFLHKLTLIEQHFGQVYIMHNSEYTEDLNLIKVVNSVNKTVEDADAQIQQMGPSDEKEILNQYIKWKKAEFDFYKSYCLSDEDYVNGFRKAAKQYKEMFPLFNIRLPLYMEDSYNAFSPPSKKMSDDSLASAIYLLNSLGESYSKLAQTSGLNGNTIPLTPDAKKQYAKQAIFYCGCAVLWSESKEHLKSEAYYRNLGCAFERLSDLMGKKGELYGEEIIGNYEKAYAWMIVPANNKRMAPKSMESVYHTILSFYERWLSAKYRDIEEKNEVLQTMLGPEHRVDKEIASIAYKYYALSRKAVEHWPQYAKYESLHGFSIWWVMLLREAQTNILIPTLDELLKELKEVTLHLDAMGISDNYALKVKTRQGAIIRAMDNWRRSSSIDNIKREDIE